MIRCRFTVVGQEDYRPVNWPIKHPYWCTGYSEEGAIVVAYADDEAEIRRNWPEAANLDSTEASDYVFTSRFPCPDWFTAADQPSSASACPFQGPGKSDYTPTLCSVCNNDFRKCAEIRAADQPNAARKTVWKPYDVFGVTGRLVYEDTGEDIPDQPGEAGK